MSHSTVFLRLHGEKNLQDVCLSKPSMSTYETIVHVNHTYNTVNSRYNDSIVNSRYNDSICS